MNQDAEHLRLLSIFHYVVACLSALFSLFPIFHLVFGLLMVTGTLEPQDPAAAVFGWFFVLFALAVILGGLTFSFCLALAGRFLSKRKHYTYCLVMAALACMCMPFGTVLGVFTIVVLVRPSVRDSFEQRSFVAPGVSSQ